MTRLAWREAEVADTVPETARVVTLVLQVPGWPGHRAGQHVDVRLTAEDGYQAQRSYSIGSAPGLDRLALTVERIEEGEVSPYLVEEVLAGDRLELRGPIGGYFVWDTDGDTDGDTDRGGRLLLAAGGSGVVPLMSMVRHRASVGSTVPTRLLYSSRSEADVIYRTELDELAADGSGLEVVHTLTRVQPPGWTGYDRRVDAAMLADVAWPADANPLAFVCGPTRFVESVAGILLGMGYDRGRIRTERFGPTGTDGPEGDLRGR